MKERMACFNLFLAYLEQIILLILFKVSYMETAQIAEHLDIQLVLGRIGLDPLVIESIQGADSFLRIVGQHFLDQIFGVNGNTRPIVIYNGIFIRSIRWEMNQTVEFKFPSLDLVQDLILCATSEGGVPTKQDI